MASVRMRRNRRAALCCCATSSHWMSGLVRSTAGSYNAVSTFRRCCANCVLSSDVPIFRFAMSSMCRLCVVKCASEAFVYTIMKNTIPLSYGTINILTSELLSVPATQFWDMYNLTDVCI